MKGQEKARPRLKNLDDLFLLNADNKPDDNSDTAKSPATLVERYQSYVSINSLVPFTAHPFRLYEGERLEDMVESIKANGVLIPIIAREKDNKLEILAGHNRVNASKLAGKDEIPAILLKNVSDEEAWIYVIETNLMQRSFADMSHSEKAAVLATRYNQSFSQGKRNDILNALKMIENPHGGEENGTSPQLGAKLRTDEKIGEDYSLSKNTVARYLRIHQLIQPLKDLLDNGVIAFIPAVTLSFLKASEQKELAYTIELNGFSCDMKKADILRRFSEDGKLNEDSTFLILNGELGQKPKPNRTPVVKVDKTIYARYFQPNQPASEVQDIVEKALELYFGSHERQKKAPDKPSILGQLADAQKEAAAIGPPSQQKESSKSRDVVNL